MPTITLEAAKQIISAAIAKAAEMRLKPLTVAVLDSGGHLIALERQDGASIARPQIAIAKAAGALALGVSSRKIGDMAAERPQFVASLASIAVGGVVPAAGGIIVLDGDGRPLGAIGITGDLSDHDEACAIAGAEAAGLKFQG